VESFVKKMGEKMGYHVAIDALPVGAKDDVAGAMATTWLTASEEEGIPTAFVVDRSGKIAWIGHPMELDEPLERIVAGTWDLKTAAAERTEALALQKTLGRIETLLEDKAKNSEEIIAQIDQTVAKMPSLARSLAPHKYDALLHGDNCQAASAYGAELVDGMFRHDFEALNYIAWLIVDPEAKLDASRRDVKLALRAAGRANELTKGKESAILDTLAEATFLSGDAARAVALQEEAMKRTPEKVPGMAERLAVFRKAARAK
jgi:hypothetical protein